jgi:oligopeptide/dipeptide ABC transporter ATP-binding protein
MTSLSIMRLLPQSMIVQSGEISYNGKDLLLLSDKDMQELRGKEIAMIFQEPMTSLNPVLTIGFQVGEVLRRHYPKMNKEEIEAAVIEQLGMVGIPNPQKCLSQYPHQFSGGMRQRAMIAMASICHPRLLIADEPTTALDVTIQAQVLDLLSNLKQIGSLMLITHNLGVVAEVCAEVVVMYAGQVVEKGRLEDIFDHPSHPYTVGLMASIPTLASEKRELYSIPGAVPSLESFNHGCRFADRCEKVLKQCPGQRPPSKALSATHEVTCWLDF